MSWLLGPVDTFLLGRTDVWCLQQWLPSCGSDVVALLGAHIHHLITSYVGSAEDEQELRDQLGLLYRIELNGREQRLQAAAITQAVLAGRLDMEAGCCRLADLRKSGAAFIPFIFHAYANERDNAIDWEEKIDKHTRALFDELTEEDGIADAIA